MEPCQLHILIDGRLPEDLQNSFIGAFPVGKHPQIVRFQANDSLPQTIENITRRCKAVERQAFVLLVNDFSLLHAADPLSSPVDAECFWGVVFIGQNTSSENGVSNWLAERIRSGSATIAFTTDNPAELPQAATKVWAAIAEWESKDISVKPPLSDTTGAIESRTAHADNEPPTLPTETEAVEEPAIVEDQNASNSNPTAPEDAHQEAQDIAPAEATLREPHPPRPAGIIEGIHKFLVNGEDQLKDYRSPILYQYHSVPATDAGLYPVPNYATDQIQGVKHTPDDFWVIGGASVRGKSHENAGTPRDDAFKLGRTDHWNITAVSDGAGSAALSRIAATESVKIAVATAEEVGADITTSDIDVIKTTMKQALENSIRAVYRKQLKVIQQYNTDKSSTYCTFMMLIHHPLPHGGCVFGTLHIGDGYMLGYNAQYFNRITEGDHSEDTRRTRFVLSLTEEQAVQRAAVYYVENTVDTFMIMTDGIENDLKPSSEDFLQGKATLDNNAQGFAQQYVMQNYLRLTCWRGWGKDIQKLISYQRYASNDDRTLTVLTRRPNPDACPPEEIDG